MDSAKGNSVVLRGTADNLQSAIAAAEEQIGMLLNEKGEKTKGRRAA
jgi:hypothetical protein